MKKVVQKKYGLDASNVGDEGGFAPNILNNQDGLDLLMEAIEKAGHSSIVDLGMDVAASEFLTKDGNYDLDFKTENNSGELVKTPEQLTEMYAQWIEKYPIKSIEDPFDQDDWPAYQHMLEKLGDRV